MDKEIARYYYLIHSMAVPTDRIIIGSNTTLFDWERAVKKLFERFSNRCHLESVNIVSMYCVKICQDESGYSYEQEAMVARWGETTMYILREDIFT